MEKSMAKGSIYLIIASVIFVTTGYIIHIGLARILGPANYGIYGVVVSIMSIFNLILTSGISQAISKYISAGENGEVVKKSAIKFQVAFSLLVFAAYEILADLFALALGDASLAYYIRISGFTLIGYSLYAVSTGYFNGLKEFKKQAGIQIGYSVSKLVFVLGLVILGFSLTGVFIGFAFAPVIGFLMGVLMSEKIKPSGEFDWKKLADFAWPVIIFSVAVSFLISIDLFSVKAILGQNIETGYYNAATTIARVPYTILSAVCLSLFPVISGTIARKNTAKTKMYIRETIRYVLILLIPLTLIVSTTSQYLVSILYTSQYIYASMPLSILMAGFLFLTVFGIFASIICAKGEPKTTMAVSLFLVTLSLILNRILIPVYGLNGAAIATAITSFTGMLILYAYTKRHFGNIVNFASILKVILASIPVFLLSLAIALPNKWLLLIEYPLLFLLYLAILILIKELNRKDFERFYEALPQKIRAYLQNLKLIPR